LERGADKGRVIYETKRRMITVLIDDVIRESRRRLACLDDQSLAGVRAAGVPVIAASTLRAAELESLRDYLYANLYRHPRIMRIMGDAEGIVRDLFQRYVQTPAELPASWREVAEREGGSWCAAMVADFVAGMTDRYALNEHRRLFDATPELR
jgi:dGTPase